MSIKLLVITVFLNCLFYHASNATVKICYWESWSTLSPSDIDTGVCTHINYAFLGINSDGSLRIGNDAPIKRLSDIKKTHGTKLLVSIGGWNEGSTTFSSVAASPEKRNKMATSCVDFLRRYKFDGIDIDWEYPGQRGGQAADKTNYIALLTTLRQGLKSSGNHLLTVAVGSSPQSGAYDVRRISDTVDYINLMTYDFALDGKTSANAPLYASSKNTQWEKNNANCDAAVKNWKRAGANPKKLTLGLAFYGYSYKLTDPHNNGVGAPTTGAKTSIPYNQICRMKGNGWKENFDHQQMVPYKVNGNTWITYDNPESIKQKAQYVKRNGLGGVMVWAVDQDDKAGACGTKNALLNEIKRNS